MGKVYLVGAGPGDPDLLTVKAARLLATADVVLHDALVSDGVLALISSRAACISVGKRRGHKLLSQDEIDALLVSYAADHEVVVRLKGGDPLIFGRAAEEIAALQRHGVAFEIVPGVTAAFGAAAAARFPLTDRRKASQVLLTTFARGQASPPIDANLVSASATIAVYMPGSDYGDVATWLLDSGLSPDTPCAVISQATTPSQSVQWNTIATLYDAEPLPAPSVLIAGRVAQRAGLPEVADQAVAHWHAHSRQNTARPVAAAWRSQ
jgi:uroporphyrin-III C-methyltransferase